MSRGIILQITSYESSVQIGIKKQATGFTDLMTEYFLINISPRKISNNFRFELLTAYS